MLVVQFFEFKIYNFYFIDVIFDVLQLIRMVMFKLKQYGVLVLVFLVQKLIMIWERGCKNYDKMVKVNDQCYFVNGILLKIMDMKM